MESDKEENKMALRIGETRRPQGSAKMVRATNLGGQYGPSPNSFLPKVMLFSGTEISRWMVLNGGPEAERSFREQHLGGIADTDTPEKKLGALTGYVGPEAAGTGVLFGEEFKRSDLGRYLEVFFNKPPAYHMDENPILGKVGMSFTGVVQNCGARGALSRILNLVCPEARGHFRNDEGQKDILGAIIYSIRMHSLFAFAGLVTRTIIGISDIGWGLAPHNLVVNISTDRRAPLLPLGVHMYTAQINGCRGLPELPLLKNAIADDIQRQARRFVIDQSA